MAAVDQEEIKRHNLNFKQKQKLITAVTTKITVLRQKETTVEKELRILEVNLGLEVKKIEALDKNHLTLNLKLKKHQQQAKPLQDKLRIQKTKLAKHIKLAYFIGRQNLTRILFNHLGNQRLAKSLSLHQYIRNKHAEALDEYLKAFSLLKQKQRKIETQKAKIKSLLDETKFAQKNLKKELKQRLSLLNTLKIKLKDQEFSLKKRHREANDLSNLIQRLEVSIGSLPIEMQPTMRFSVLKGRLPQPVSSQKPTRVSDTKGLLFKVAHGAEVRAVASGRVIFSDWLRGYGLLIILDHGDGYMSLYGRNQSLYRTKGEWVQTGALLAKVGDTGGVNRPGLYFDIRLKGKSVAVLDWF